MTKRVGVVGAALTLIATILVGGTSSAVADTLGVEATIGEVHCVDKQMIIPWTVVNAANPDTVTVELKFNEQTVATAILASGQKASGQYKVTTKPYAVYSLDFWVNGQSADQLKSTYAPDCKNPQIGPTIEGPSMAGVFRVGRAITADPGIWVPTPTSFKYQWYCKGRGQSRPLPGATRRTYTIPPSVAGCWLHVRVTGVREGYKSGAWGVRERLVRR